MLKNYTLITVLIFVLHSAGYAQNGDIRGTVKEGGEPNLTAFVQLKKGQAIAANGVVDDHGSFIFSELTPGDYTVTVLALGVDTITKNVYLSDGGSKFLAISLISGGGDQLGVVEVIAVALDRDPPRRPIEIIESPYDGLLGLISQDPSVTKVGGALQSGSARPGQLAVIKNNAIQIGPLNPATFNLGEVKVISAGVPAMYGDFVGGAIEYTTSDILDPTAIRQIMVRSSSPFNAYHQNAIETYLYKPLIVEDGHTKLAITHSLFAGFQIDPNPSSIDLYGLKENVENDLLETPFTNYGGGASLPTASGFRNEDFVKVNTKQNAAATNLYTSAMLSYKPSRDLVLRIEPSIQYTRQNQFSFSNSLLNSGRNPLNTSVIGKINAQIQHTLKRPYSSSGQLMYDSSLFSKINYQLIADYQRVNSKTVDPIHGDNVFEYGHIGKFTSTGTDRYTYVDGQRYFTDQNGEKVLADGFYEFQDGYEETSLQFEASEHNIQRAAITRYALENNTILNLSQLQESQGLLNGQNPTAINSMWYAPGTLVSNYAKSDQQKGSLKAILNIAMNPTRELGKQHDIQIGTLFEQRRRSYYSLNANGLWRLMPQLVNRQYNTLDYANPILSYDEQGMFTDTVSYNYINDLSRQSNFDQSLRGNISSSNGYTIGGAQFIDINELDPSAFSIDMFSADELWNNGESYLGYAGYDHTGKLMRSKKSLNDFLNDRANRFVNAYNPNYSALWIQDKFVLEKIKIRAGVRIERFDANQSVLKDPYSLYPVQTASEVNTIAGQTVSHPSNISKEAAVYVNDLHRPTEILGYREGGTWYDERGVELSSPESIRIKTASGVIQPLLVDPNNQNLTDESFKDYEPEILILPRLSFSFPISSKALFYAYYDKFAQRPSFGQSFAPISSYYYLENASNTILPNPELKPAKRTDYQIGFKRLVGTRGKLNIRVGYADIKNDINLISIEQAYPRSYITYSNSDFSTIKSFGGDYELSLTSINLRANYLLQFADGTGSNANSAAALIQANQPNLRSLYPLQYDVRHKINGSVTVALDSLGKKKISIFRHMQINIFGNAQSGTPYTALVNAIPEAQSLGSASRSQIKGNPFGSRLPWNYSVDLSISKVFFVRQKPIVAQLNALNLLNISKIYNVYAYSSSPSDDGYLSSPQGQQRLNTELSAQSFADYYSLKNNDPVNFGKPRMISLTLRTTF
ncbi:MAG: hypothetical protein QNL27_08150 [Bacteroidia bacterium]